MVTLAWYNLVAIAVGIFALIWIFTGNEVKSYGYLSGVGEGFYFLFKVITIIFFYIIWGGIFWW